MTTPAPETTTQANETTPAPETTTTTADKPAEPVQPADPGELEMHMLDLSDGNYGSYYFINRDWDSLSDLDGVDGFFLTEGQPATIEMLDERYSPFYVYEDNEAEFATIEDFAKGKNIEAGKDISAALGFNGEAAKWVAMSIHIANYGDAELSAEECLNNGWWYVTDKWGEHQFELLGFSKSSEVYDVLRPEQLHDSNNRFSIAYLDYIHDRLGKPDFFVGDTSFNVYAKRNMPGIESIARGECQNNELKLTAVFEFDEYVCTSYLRDTLTDDGKSLVESPVLSYYTKEAWEQEKAHFDNDTKNQVFVLVK